MKEQVMEKKPQIKQKVIDKAEIQYEKVDREQIKYMDATRIAKEKEPEKMLQHSREKERKPEEIKKDPKLEERKILKETEGQNQEQRIYIPKESENHENLLDGMDNWYYYHMPSDEELATNNSEIRENLEDKVEEIITDKQLGVLPDGSTFNMPDDASLDELYMLGSDYGAESYVNYHHSEVKEQVYEDLAFEDMDEDLDPRYS